ncbi:hypothetical protein BDW60DRAFT_207292 [Aspergillus nidulans var. acristatus]
MFNHTDPDFKRRLFFNSSANTASFLFWLQSLNRFSESRLNQLNSISPVLGIFFILFINFSTDLFLERAWAIALATSINFSSLVVLAIWNVPESAKWFAYTVQYSAVAVSSVLYGWVNVIYRDSIEERAVVLVLITAISTSWTAWVPLFTYPTVEGPRFMHGYSFSAAITGLLVAMTFSIRSVYGPNGERNRSLRKKARSRDSESEGTSIRPGTSSGGARDMLKNGSVSVAAAV